MAPRRTDTNRLNEALKLVPSYLGQAGLWDRFYRDAYLQVAAAASAAVAKSPVPAVEPAYARGLLEMAEREHGVAGTPGRLTPWRSNLCAGSSAELAWMSDA